MERWCGSTLLRPGRLSPITTSDSDNCPRITARLPSSRMSSTAELRPAAAFLAGDAAANIHCMTLALDGGFTVV